jgi:hypothetical protein
MGLGNTPMGNPSTGTPPTIPKPDVNPTGALPSVRSGDPLMVLEEMFRRYRMPSMNRQMISSILPQLLSQYQNWFHNQNQQNATGRYPLPNQPASVMPGSPGVILPQSGAGLGGYDANTPNPWTPLDFEEWINQQGPARLLTQAIGSARRPLGGSAYLAQVLQNSTFGASRKRTY